MTPKNLPGRSWGPAARLSSAGRIVSPYVLPRQKEYLPPLTAFAEGESSSAAGENFWGSGFIRRDRANLAQPVLLTVTENGHLTPWWGE